MKDFSVSSFFRRPSDKAAHIEDRVVISVPGNFFGVTAGNSAAPSSLHPPLMYEDVLTGGAMVSHEASLFAAGLTKLISLEVAVRHINRRIRDCHQSMGVDPVNNDDVGGASFAFCQPTEDEVKFLLGGDCFALVIKEKASPLFISGFDRAAFDLEAKDWNAYNACLERTKVADGGQGIYWDLYWSRRQQQRIFSSNRNIGHGGVATLNGDPMLEGCWVSVTMLLEGVYTIILGTGGLLPPSEVNPDQFKVLAQTIALKYDYGGMPAVAKWRDRVEAQKNADRHIGGWPEAAAVILDFNW